MSRYFVSPDGRIAGEVLVETPANPDGLQIIESEGIQGDWADYLWNGSSVVHSPIPPTTTQEQIIASLTAQIQKRLDDFAKTRNYDGILSACTYATSTVPKFATEGQYCVQARDATWATGYALMDEVLAGTRPVPSSIADIESELPALAWPT